MKFSVAPLVHLKPNPADEMSIDDLPGEFRSVEMLIDCFVSEERVSSIVRQTCLDAFVDY